MRISDWSSDVCSSDLFYCHLCQPTFPRLSVEVYRDLVRVFLGRLGRWQLVLTLRHWRLSPPFRQPTSPSEDPRCRSAAPSGRAGPLLACTSFAPRNLQLTKGTRSTRLVPGSRTPCQRRRGGQIPPPAEPP